jgi:hypothetical protein
MTKSLEHFKLIERISRQIRHHRMYLNQIYDQKLSEELNNLTDEYEQNFLRTKTQQKLEEQRKQILGITIQQIVNERQRSALTKILPKDRPLSSIQQSPTTSRISCHLFTHNCQLYPCQPIYHYTSFIKKEHDQILQQRNSHLIQEKQNHRQLSATAYTQHYLANRHAYMERTMARLNEQSRLLHKQLAAKKIFASVKDHQHELQQAIQRHLKMSGKFCA